MPVRLLLLLLVPCAAVGYAAGRLATARWADARASAAHDPAAAEDARRGLELVRAQTTEPERSRARRGFLEAWPDTWLRAHWAAEATR